jgi:ATP-dependent RNA helicase RhlE
MESFDKLGLIEPLLRALRKAQYEKPTPIQADAIPYLLDGRDLIGSAQTGTGKTAAFSLPMLQRFAETGGPAARKAPRALILTPTRELANQVSSSIKTYGRYLRIVSTAVYGGVSIIPQARTLARGVDILVATPGRLLDLMNQRMLFLDNLEVFVLDEADRMLDMGFINDIKRIIAALPAKRQSLFFSATMPPVVSRLAGSFLKNPAHVKVNPLATTAEKVEQTILFVDKKDKEALLLSLLEDSSIDRALVFTRTKYRANNIAKKLNSNRVNADAIHGNKSQGARMQALRNFSAGKTRVLVATDVASRGIDVRGITHVINFEMPNEPESYVHRIGRTARAGAAGAAISFCDGDERSFLCDIERAIKTSIPIDEEHPYHSKQAASSRPNGNGQAKRRNFRPRRRQFRSPAGR